MSNQLGSFTFISLHAGTQGGAPEDLTQHLSIVQRPGVNDTEFILTGIKGAPFRMNSLASYATFGDAFAALAG
jgi:hypothetical protein